MDCHHFFALGLHIDVLRHIRILLIGLVAVVVVTAAAGWVVYHHYSQDLPDFDALSNYEPAIVTRVLAGDGRLMAEYAKEKRVFVPIKAMPPQVTSAVIAAEDREFYQHPGIDVPAIVKREMTNILHPGRRQAGASTITQQVARIFLLNNEYSYVRKIKEAILAVRIDQALTKDQILELYLNAPDFGRNSFGIAEAALTYFNKSLDELSVPEAALLAGLLKGPSYYDPYRHPDRAKDRRDYVIDGMAEIGAITREQAKAAISEPIVLRKRSDAEIISAPYPTEEVRRDLIARFGESQVYQGGLSVRTSIDPALQLLATKSLRTGLAAYDRRHGWRGPVGHLTVTKDGNWQTALAAAPLPPGAAPWKLALALEVKSDGAEIGLASGETGWIPFSEMSWARPTLSDQHFGNPPKAPSDVMKPGDLVLVEPIASTGARDVKQVRLPEFALRQIPNVSGAILALDPHTGRIMAMTGGWSFEASQFNRATQAKRQIGSTFKPFAYLAALENGMTPSTLISAEPVAIDAGEGQPTWRPKNFESSESEGVHTLRWAIEHSINTMTVRMASTIGIDKIAPYIERLGIMDHMPLEYSMVLGAGETTLMRLTTAYATLDNGGKQISPSLIDRVQDRNGQTIYRHDDRACPRCGDFAWAQGEDIPILPDPRAQLLDPGTAYQMVDILTGVVQRGTGAAIGAAIKYPLAGKTGTSNGPNDTWFEGFSPDLAVGIFVGFDEPRTLGSGEQGASVAAPIFQAFMSEALKGKTPVDFRIPPGIRLVRVDAETGRMAEPGDRDVIWEAFKPGTEPAAAEEEESVILGGSGIQTVRDDASPPTAQGGAAAPPPVPTQPQTPSTTAPSSTAGGLY